jgi:hypothetical protein
MLKALQHNTLLQIVFILIAVVALWLRAFVSPDGMEAEQYFSPIYGLLHRLLIGVPRLALAIGLLLMLAEGIWFNVILSNNKLTKVNWLMPALMFVLAMSWSGGRQSLTPMLLAWLPLIAGTSQLLSTGNTNLEVDRIFNAAFLVGVAALCYLPIATYVVPFLFLFVTYKSYKWRDIIVAIMGLSAPIFLLLVYAFLTDKLEYYWILIRHDIIDIKITFDTSNIVATVANVIFLLLLLWGFFSQLATIKDNTIQQRINTIILLLPFVATLLMLLYDKIFIVNTQYAALPFALIASNLIATDRKRGWINEVAFALLFLTPIILQTHCFFHI